MRMLMRMHAPRLSLAVMALFALLTASTAGCTTKAPLYKVKGKLVDGDKAVVADPKSSILLTFVQQVEAEQPFNMYTARITDDVATGEFLITGEAGEGLPKGNYRIKLRTMSPQPSPLALLINKKFNNDKSPLMVTITDDKTPLVIDIAPYKNK